MSRIPISPKDLPDQVAWMKVMRDARKEMHTIVAQNRLNIATTRNVPSAADAASKIEHSVLMFREKPIVNWVGPFTVRNEEGKLVTLETRFKILLASIE